MSTLIKQRTTNDCGVACIAMYLGCDYEAAVELARKATKGAWTPDMPVNFATELATLRLAGHSSAIVQEFDPERPAIISILSLNFPDLLHAVYWNGNEVYDPSPLKTADAETAFSRCVSFTQRLTDLATLMLRAKKFERVKAWRPNA
jgi:hypothetical protein